MYMHVTDSIPIATDTVPLNLIAYINNPLNISIFPYTRTTIFCIPPYHISPFPYIPCPILLCSYSPIPVPLYHHTSCWCMYTWCSWSIHSLLSMVWFARTYTLTNVILIENELPSVEKVLHAIHTIRYDLCYYGHTMILHIPVQPATFSLYLPLGRHQSLSYLRFLPFIIPLDMQDHS